MAPVEYAGVRCVLPAGYRSPRSRPGPALVIAAQQIFTHASVIRPWHWKIRRRRTQLRVQKTPCQRKHRRTLSLEEEFPPCLVSSSLSFPWSYCSPVATRKIPQRIPLHPHLRLLWAPKTYPSGEGGLGDGAGRMLDHEAIPGFMEAMTMSYKLKDPSVASELHPGDRITATFSLPRSRRHRQTSWSTRSSSSRRPSPTTSPPCNITYRSRETGSRLQAAEPERPDDSPQPISSAGHC